MFDLGNRKIVAYTCPGHTAGHMVFTGDCCNYNRGSRFATSTRIRDLKKLRAGYGKTYDRIFTGHTTYCGTLDVKSHDIAVVDGLIEAFRSLLRGDAVFSERVMQLFPERPPHKVVLYGPIVQYPHENGSGPLVCPSFNPDMLWEEGEEHIVP